MKKRYMILIILMGLVIVLMGLYIVKINTGSKMEPVEKEVKIEEKKEVYKGIELEKNEKVVLLNDTYEALDPRDDIIDTDYEVDDNGDAVQAPRYANGEILEGAYMDPYNEMYEFQLGSGGPFHLDDIAVFMDVEHLMVRELGRSGHIDAYIGTADSLDIKEIDNTLYRVSGMAYIGDQVPLGNFDIELHYDFGAVNSWIDYKWKMVEEEN